MSEQVSPAIIEQIESTATVVTATKLDMQRDIEPIFGWDDPGWAPTKTPAIVGPWIFTIENPQPRPDWPAGSEVELCIVVPRHGAFMLPACVVLGVSEEQLVVQSKEWQRIVA